MALYSEQNTCDTQGWQITVGIIEDNFRENFLARQDVEIDLLTLKDLDENTIDPIDFTEVRLHSQQLYLQGLSKQLQVTAVRVTDQAIVFPLYVDNNDFKGQFGFLTNPTGFIYSLTNVYFKNNADYERTFTINGKIKCRARQNGFSSQPFGYVPNDFPQNIYYRINNGDTIISTVLLVTGILEYDTISNPWTTFEYTFTNFSLTLQPNQSFTIFADRISFVIPFVTTIYIKRDFEFNWPEENYLNWVELNQSTASNCKGLYIFNFLKRILHIITGNATPLVSDYFSVDNAGLMWNNLITTGLYIRNGQLLDQANPQITTSFKGFFEDLSNIFNLGWGFEYNETLSVWQIRIEPMEYFYNAGIQIAEFNKVSNITQYAQVEDLVNSFKIGFTDDWKNIAVSGMFEPHTYRSYFTPNKSGSAEKKVLDLRSNIIASGYAIEFSRRLQELRDDSGSSDRPNDYNLFIIWLNREEIIIDFGFDITITIPPGKASVGSDMAGSTNAPIGEIYNILHTPARIAARWWKYLGMNTFGLPTAKAALFFQSGEYYTALESEIDSAYFPVANQEITGMVSEKTNISKAILQSDINAYLFKPIGLDFSVPQSLCSFIDMANNGIGIIKMTSGNQSFYGFLQNATNKPVDPKSGISNFKLLLANNVPYVAGFSEGFSDGFG
jgi:hypothetical protein